MEGEQQDRKVKRKPIVKVESDYSSEEDSSSSESVQSERRSSDSDDYGKKKKSGAAGISSKSKVIKKKSKEQGVVNFDDSEESDSEAEVRKHRQPLKDIYKEKRRGFTISIVVPSSIIDNAQSYELKTYLVGQIAKAAGLF